MTILQLYKFLFPLKTIQNDIILFWNVHTILGKYKCWHSYAKNLYNFNRMKMHVFSVIYITSLWPYLYHLRGYCHKFCHKEIFLPTTCTILMYDTSLKRSISCGHIDEYINQWHYYKLSKFGHNGVILITLKTCIFIRFETTAVMHSNNISQ